MRFATLMLLAVCLFAEDYRPPAGTKPAARRPGAETILPGGRRVTPLGRGFATGPGTFGLALSHDGKFAATADGGPNKFSLTILERSGDGGVLHQVVAGSDKDEAGNKGDKDKDDDWHSVFLGLAFDSHHKLYSAEGNSGRVRRVSVPSGKLDALFELNQGEWRDSYSADLALDEARHLLFVLDQANFRLAIFDTQSRKLISSIRTGRLPFRLALSADDHRAYVTNIGMFEYKPIPGVDRRDSRETGLNFPPFGFPSAEARDGVVRTTERGPVNVPGLGDPNVPESNSLCVIDVSNAGQPKTLAFIRTGEPLGPLSMGGSSPSGIVVAPNAVYVSNANQDSITVVDPAELKVRATIPIRRKGLENFRGVLPLGMAYSARNGWLLVAEAGINAVAVIDTGQNQLLGHIPAAWFPTAVAIHKDDVFVCTAKGLGTGPSATRTAPLEKSSQADLRAGLLSEFPMPSAGGLTELTASALANAGLSPSKTNPALLPPEIRYVVVIMKENRTYDEVFGGMEKASNGPLNGAPELARFGERGYVVPTRDMLRSRLSHHYVNITPNHHALARRFSFSDNFYTDSEVSVDGHHWIVGSYPNAWTESSLMAAYGGQKDFRLPTTAPGRLLFPESNSSVHPEELLEAGALWHHLERNGVSFRNYGEGLELAGASEGEGLKPTGARFFTNIPIPDPLWRNTSRDYPLFNMNIPDQYRATQFINEIQTLYGDTGADLPRFIFLYLPNDHTAKPRAETGYPFLHSYISDNDLALGRIVQHLSSTRWWKNMAIFVTEDDAQGGVDHIDSHRTVLLVASPYARRNFSIKANSSFPGLLKTIFRLLGIPPLNLFDATAADLAECFTSTPDFEPFVSLSVDPEIFNPLSAREPLDPKPSPKMDDADYVKSTQK
jgi:YVTN family beta-propeller protein